MVRMGVHGESMVALHTSIHKLSALQCASLRFARAKNKPKTEEAYQIMRFLLEWQKLKRADLPLKFLEWKATDGLTAVDRALRRPDAIRGLLAFRQAYVRCIGDEMGTINRPNATLIKESPDRQLRIVCGPFLDGEPTILKSAVRCDDAFEAEYRKIQLLREYLILHKHYLNDETFYEHMACLRGIVKVAHPGNDCDIWLVFHGQYTLLSDYLLREKLTLREKWRVCRMLFRTVLYMQSVDFANFEERIGSRHALSLENFLITVTTRGAAKGKGENKDANKKAFKIRWNYDLGKTQHALFNPPYEATNFSRSEVGDYFGLAVAFYLILTEKNFSEFVAWYRRIVRAYEEAVSDEDAGLNEFERELENEFTSSTLPPMVRSIVVKLVRFGYQDLTEVHLDMKKIRVRKMRHPLSGSLEERFVPFDSVEEEDVENSSPSLPEEEIAELVDGKDKEAALASPEAKSPSPEESGENITGNKRKRDSPSPTSKEDVEEPPKKKIK